MRTVLLFGMITIAKCINPELIADYSYLMKKALIIAILLDLFVEVMKQKRSTEK